MEKVIEFHATQPDERILERLRKVAANPEAVDRATPQLDVSITEGLLGWIQHVADLAGLIDAGCRFSPDELRPEEWDSLRLWRSAEARFGQRYAGCPGCGRAMRRSAKSHGCGWKAS